MNGTGHREGLVVVVDVHEVTGCAIAALCRMILP